ncbi:MAG: hypothetical protein HQ481_04495 [Alphaproteobacteria bacterium]|nr:hypothetical protein [Alphaproteobacteria bacterium]
MARARTPPPYFAPAHKPRHAPPVDVDFAAENIRQLRALWTSKRPGRSSLPAWKLFDPLEMRPWDDHLILYDVERKDQDLAYRFVTLGVHAARVSGGDHAGAYLHDALSPTDIWALAGHLDATVNARGPIEVHEVAPYPDGSAAVKWDKLFLPLADNGRTVNQLLALVYAEKIAVPENRTDKLKD